VLLHRKSKRATNVSKLTLPGSDFNSANRFRPLANGAAGTATRLFNRSIDSSLNRETVRSQNFADRPDHGYAANSPGSTFNCSAM
jgi:hypothetical protein